MSKKKDSWHYDQKLKTRIGKVENFFRANPGATLVELMIHSGKSYQWCTQHVQTAVFGGIIRREMYSPDSKKPVNAHTFYVA
jgi:hypothetical protein